MPSFNYIAMKNNKSTVKGKVDAPDLKAARAQIRKLGLNPVKITEDTDFTAKEKRAQAKRNELPSLPLKDKIDFTCFYGRKCRNQKR